MIEGFDTARWAEWRRPFDKMEAQVVKLHRDHPDADSEAMINALRYVISFARLTTVTNPDQSTVDLSGPLHRHSLKVKEELTTRLSGDKPLFEALRAMPKLIESTKATRSSLIEHMNINRAALEAEVTERKLVMALGGGGGAGYAYAGVLDFIERIGLTPSLLVGTSIGSLICMFRARSERFDMAAMVNLGKQLNWSRVFRVLETKSRYGIPAALRLYLRATVGPSLETEDGRQMRFTDTKIPLHIVVAGVTMDALKHDILYYEHLLDSESQGGLRLGVKSVFKILSVVKEFLTAPEALREIVMGRDSGTEEIDIVDAAGFSSSVPGVMHYDVLRDDPRTHRLLDNLYAKHGITRLSEGGLVSNVPARIAWESLASGQLGTRSGIVVAVDCFAPNPLTPVFLALQTLVHAANVRQDKKYADLYLALPKSISPMNVVPSQKVLMRGVESGAATIAPYGGFLQDMANDIPGLAE